MKSTLILVVSLGSLLLAGCSSFSDIETRSPTLALLRGDITPDQYDDALTAANERVAAEEEFERNKVPTRAYNTKTGKFEFVPEDTQQQWNPETERWEFTPREASENRAS